MADAMSGPKRDPLSVADNPTGHQYGKGRSDGYALCDWCGCRENTAASAERCPEAVKTLFAGDVESIWCRRRKYLPPDGRERHD